MSENLAPYTLSALEALRRIEAGTLTAPDWVRSCEERIRAREPEIRAWASLNDQVSADADARAGAGGSPSIPVGVKDIIDVCGLPTMMGTDFHDPRPATREGGSVAIMRDAGCVFMGKTVTTELGHRHPGPTRNPHNTRHTPGGSSSGSAAAVADFMVPLCLGTQTTASVIRPAAYCGIVGYKPTYGDFDKSGILANAPSMDTLGLMARTVDDVGLLRGILLEEPHQNIAEVDLSALRFGLLDAPPWEGADQETRDLISGFSRDIAGVGGQLKDVAIGPKITRLIELHRLISGYEFGRSIAFERTRHLDQLSAILRDGRLADGREVDSRGYQLLVQEAAALRGSIRDVFSEVDILISPSAAGPAPATLETTGDAAFSAAWSLAGNPVMTVPLFTASATHMPIGCQLIAGFGRDDQLLSAAKAIVHRFGS